MLKTLFTVAMLLACGFSPVVCEVTGPLGTIKVPFKPEVQVAFNNAKGSMPVRGDVDMSTADPCMQKALKAVNGHKAKEELDTTGKLVDTATVYPHEPKRDWNGALATLGALCMRHKVELIAIGNGTASRETDKLAADLIKRLPEQRMTKIVVSEAGASVYSASEFASKELPELDVSLRGAVSIARRLQDPLAELVKIDPKSIGVGQYQHDVNQSELAKSLDAVIEDCVNSVGVDLNTASAPLRSRLSSRTIVECGSTSLTCRSNATSS